MTDIYAAALEPERFGPVFARLAAEVGVAAAGIKFQARSGEGVVQYWVGLPPAFEAAFVAEYWRDDPWTEASMAVPVGEAFFSGRVVSARTLERNRFYNELCRPFGFRDALGGAVLQTAEQHVTIGCMRERGARGNGMREVARLSPYLRHFGMVAKVSLALSASRHESSALANALERLPVAAIVVDSEARVRHANRLGRAIIDADDGLGTRAGCLVAQAREAHRALTRVLGLQQIGVELTVPRPSGRAAYGVITAPLSRELTGTLPSLSRPMTLVYVIDPTTQASAPELPLMRRMFDLTAAETRLLGALATGQTPAECAASLGVQLPTVRSQLAQLFAKTGTRRQAELSRLAARCLALSAPER